MGDNEDNQETIPRVQIKHNMSLDYKNKIKKMRVERKKDNLIEVTQINQQGNQSSIQPTAFKYALLIYQTLVGDTNRKK